MSLFRWDEASAAFCPVEPEKFEEIRKSDRTIEEIVDWSEWLSERRQLKASEEIVTNMTQCIKTSLMDWVNAGQIAWEICYTKAYKILGIKSWKQYCQEVLGLQVWTIDRIRKAAKVILFLIEHMFTVLPSCVSQAMELYPLLKKNPEKLLEVWRGVINKYPKHNPLTSPRCLGGNEGGSQARGKEEKYKTLRMPKELFDRCLEKADSMKMTITQYFNWCANDREMKFDLKTEQELIDRESLTESERMEIWEKDLEDLQEERKAYLKSVPFWFKFSNFFVIASRSFNLSNTELHDKDINPYSLS